MVADMAGRQSRHRLEFASESILA